VASPHPQRAGARLELKGDVFDYCRAAAFHLAPGGAFCFCHAAADPRPEPAIEAAGLRLVHRHEVVFRPDQPPLIALFTCAWEGQRRPDATFRIRSEDGRWTEDYLAMRAEMGTIVWNREVV
jgi:tRNA1(Val) A37 N6-methylase TrmN6